MAPDGELVEVEVDADLPPGSFAPDGGGERRTAARRRAGRRRAGIAVLVAAVLAAGGTAVATGAERRAVERDDAAVRDAGTVPGTVASLREPLRDAWEPAGRLVGAAGAVVLVEEGEPVELVARSRTGDRLWRIPVPGGRAGALRCPTDLADGSTVVCEIPAREVGAPNTTETMVQQPGSLVLLRAADGAVRQAWATPEGTVAWGVLEGSDLAVVGRSDGQLVVRRLRVGAGEPVWTVRQPLPAGTSARDLAVEVTPGAVVASGAAGLVVGPDGSVLGPWLPEAGTAAVDVVATEAGAVVWRHARSGRLHRWDGAPGVTVEGKPARLPVDDGSAPGVLLVLGGTPDVLRAVDLTTGRELWSRPARASDLLVRYAGGVVLTAGRDVVAVDLTTGEERWRTPAGSPDSPLLPSITDGVRLVLPGYEVATGRTLVALGLGDGTPRWEVALPDGAWRLRSVGDAVVASGVGRAVVLAPDGPDGG